MKRYEWNTGRSYTAEGQRITAEVSEDGIAFYDHSRGIYGTMPLPWFEETNASSVRTYVMSRYDRNAYDSGSPAYAFFVRLMNEAIGRGQE